jgi:hypothetical protein
MYPLDVRHNCPQRGKCSCFAHPYLRLMNAEMKKKCLWSSTLTTWYEAGNFVTFLKHRGFGDFPITIGTWLSLPSLLTQSKTVSLSLQFFPPWQDSKGSTRRSVLRHNWRYWQRIVFKRAMYPAWRGLWLGERGSLDRCRSGFFTILKGTRREQLLRLHGACSLRAKPEDCGSQENNTTRYSTSRAEPTRARPLVRHLPSYATTCSQIVFSVPICWPSKWHHVTRRAARRLVPA